jgi:hypothetical protein
LDKTEALQQNVTFVAEDKFLRRIPEYHLKPGGEISSAAFQNDRGTNSFSTNWMKLTTIEDTLKNNPGFGLVSISAKLCWENQQTPVYAPVDENAAHCEIVGHKTESIRRKIRSGAEFLVYPKKLKP